MIEAIIVFGSLYVSFLIFKKPGEKFFYKD